MAESGDNHVHTVDNPPQPRRRKNLPSPVSETAVAAPQHGPVLLVDSTECWIAAAQYLPEGWSSAVGKPTPGTYQGHACAVIWGRNDEGGRAWAETMADTAGIPVHVISLTHAPPHWHLADGLPAGRTGEQLTAFLADAARKAQPRRVNGSAHALAAAAPVFPDVPVEFIRTATGGIEKLFSNVVVLLRQHSERWPLTYDQFSNRPFLRGEPLQDTDLRQIAEWVQHEGVRCGLSVIQEGVIRMAERATFHPVKSYLESLSWDGRKRLDTMMTTLAGAEPDASGLSNLLGRKWMIQAVARIYEPGCQADATLVMEGEQGLGKSSWFRALFGDRWFTDHLPDLRDKDAMLQLRGVWCVEVSELATLGRSDSAKIKQFLTSRVDRYRDPYGRLVSDWPRTSVFAGTINPGAEGYLKDPTGGRRFWPIPIRGNISIGGVAENRDQLWAEALTAYRAGELWHVPDADTGRRAEIADRQEARMEEDPWEYAVGRYLAQRREASMQEILREAINLTATADMDRGAQIRVGRILTSLHWFRKRVRVGGHPEWRYYRLPCAEPPVQGSLDVETGGVGDGGG